MTGRIYVRGPGIGPVRTTLWSSGHGKRPVPYKGLIFAYFASVPAVWFAWSAAPWLGILVAVAFDLGAVFVTYAIVTTRREARERARTS